jgi:hypothetical protein
MPRDLEKEIDALNKSLSDLTQEYYRNNFTSNQDFNKFSRFNSRLRVPRVSALSATCEVGEVCSFGTKLYHCSASNTWTSQT